MKPKGLTCSSTKRVDGELLKVATQLYVCRISRQGHIAAGLGLCCHEEDISRPDNVFILGLISHIADVFIMLMARTKYIRCVQVQEGSASHSHSTIQLVATYLHA